MMKWLLDVKFVRSLSDYCSHARYTKQQLMGSDAGVFIGQTTNDWVQLIGQNFGSATPYSGTGMSASVSAGRISYILGLKGPSFTVDTACSSSLVAVDNAVTVDCLQDPFSSTSVCHD